jgi:molybdate transport system substrate-binding protein
MKELMRTKEPTVLLFAALLLAALAGCGGDGAEAPSLTLFCGAANKPAVEEIAALFEKEYGIEVNLILGGSGTMLSQIEFSKSGDIYLPGSPDFIRIAERKGLIIPGSDRIVAYLVPAIVTPADNPARIETLEDLIRPGVRLAIGNPESVCLGFYGVELFEANDLLDEALSNVVTFGASCSRLVHLAALEQVDAVIGWRVCENWNPDRILVVPIAPKKIPRISYVPIAVPKYAKDRKRSEAFIDFVLSDRGKAIYAKHGYLIDLEQARAFATDARVGGEYSLPEDFFVRTKALWEKE